MNIAKCLSAVAACGFLVAAPPSASAAPLQYFLQISGITGTARVVSLTNAVSCSGYDFVTDNTGAGTTFTFKKTLDGTTSDFFNALKMSNNHSATFEGVVANGRTVVLKIVFTDLVVTSVESSDSGAQDVVPSEKITCSFYEADVTVTEINSRGQGTPQTVIIYGGVPAPNCSIQVAHGGLG